MPVMTQIIARAMELCCADGLEWQEISAIEAREYMRQAKQELAKLERSKAVNNGG